MFRLWRYSGVIKGEQKVQSSNGRPVNETSALRENLNWWSVWLICVWLRCKGGKLIHRGWWSLIIITDHCELAVRGPSCCCERCKSFNTNPTYLAPVVNKPQQNHEIFNLQMPSEVSRVPYSWGRRWIVSGRSVSQPGSGVASPPPSEPRRGSSWGTAHTRCYPEDAHIQQRTFTYFTSTRSCTWRCIFPSGCRNSNLVGSPPQLPVQSCRLIVDLHLVLPPAAL